jgi:hypothetical protein
MGREGRGQSVCKHTGAGEYVRLDNAGDTGLYTLSMGRNSLQKNVFIFYCLFVKLTVECVAGHSWCTGVSGTIEIRFCNSVIQLPTEEKIVSLSSGYKIINQFRT